MSDAKKSSPFWSGVSKSTVAEPWTAEKFAQAWADLGRREAAQRDVEPVYFLPEKQFQEWVAAGIITPDGRWVR